jgi:hypothetical protein
MVLKAWCEAELHQTFKAHKGQLYSVSFPITASSAKFAVQCPLWLGHFTAIPLFRSLDATLQSLLPRNTDEIKVLR